MSQFNLQSIRGVIPAMVTCFDEKGEVDYARIKALAKHLASKPIGGLYITGSTGETFLMDGEERCKVVEAVMDAVGGKVPVIVHVGDIGTRKTLMLAKHAHQAGADALSSVPPFYWKFSKEEVFNYYKDVAQSTPLPMIIYNIALAGLIGLDTVCRMASEVENIQAIKYTATTHFELFELKDMISKDFMLYSGADEMAISGFGFGADGIIGSTYNLMPELFIQINDLMAKNDIKAASKVQQTANRILMIMIKYGLFAAMKAAMRYKDVDAGYCRAPFLPMAPEKEAAMKADFKKLKEEFQITDVEFLQSL